MDTHNRVCNRRWRAGKQMNEEQQEKGQGAEVETER